jgi:hypothetical protein
MEESDEWANGRAEQALLSQSQQVSYCIVYFKTSIMGVSYGVYLKNRKSIKN